MKKILCFLITILLCLNFFSVAAFAANDEVLPPEMPVVDESDIEGSNELIEQYNSEVDTYNEYVEEYNAQVDETYEEEKAVVDANNEFVGHVEDEIAEDTSEARGFENYATDGEDAPTDWEDETTEELKTITIEESDTPAGETVKVINIHVYLDDSEPYAPDSFYEFIGEDNFELSEELRDRSVLTEWETAEMDINDTVTMEGENAVFAGNIVYLNGARKWMGANPNYYFFREIEGYTQGLWYQAGDLLASNATVQETGYANGGTTHTVTFEEQERESHYLYNGVTQTEMVTTRTTHINEPIKSIFSVFTYMFYRLAEEPALMEEPVKADYLEPVEKMELLVAAEPDPEPSPEPTPEPTPQPTPEPDPVVPPVVVKVDPTPEPTEEPTPEPAPEPLDAPEPETVTVVQPVVEVEELEDEIVPLVRYAGEPTVEVSTARWALVNLILALLTILGMIKFDKKKKYNLFMVLFPVAAVITFIFTEDIRLPMALTDKYTIIMLLFFIGQILSHIFASKNEEEEVRIHADLK